MTSTSLFALPIPCGRRPAEAIDALNAAMALENHHDWVKAAADRLTLGGDILWQVLATCWVNRCATPPQLETVVQPVAGRQRRFDDPITVGGPHAV